MRRMLGLLLVAIGAVSLGAQSPSDSAIVRTIKRLEEQRRVAALKGDTAALGALLAPGFYEIGVNGVFRTREQNMSDRARGDLRIDSLAFDSVDVRVFGDAAVATGLVRRGGIYRGERFEQPAVRYSRVYIRRGDAWHIVFGQNTTVAPPAASSKPKH